MNATPARLVLHADDLGMNRAVNEGILRGFRFGLLTSTSLLANAPDVDFALGQWKTLAEERASGELPSAAARRRLDDPDGPFDLGVHLNLTQGRPLTGVYPAELLDKRGRFPGVFKLFARLLRSRGRYETAIRAELERQVQVVCDHGLRPTHVNGHQYLEMIPAVRNVLPDLMEKFGIRVVRVAREPSLLRSTVLRGQPSRWPMAQVKRAFAGRFCTRIDALGLAHPDAFFGTAHAGNIDLPLLRLWLGSCCRRQVPAVREPTMIEVGLHPAEVAEPTRPKDWIDGWHDPLADRRPAELQMLVSAELSDMLAEFGWRLGRLAP
ncbi:MAG: ChbG/HpnK family deacetylase [Thermoguttaceae bacterium]